MYFSAIAITVFSNVLYHIVQKLMPTNVNPMLALIAAYLAAAIICALLLPFFPIDGPIITAIRQISPASLGLAFSIVGLEAGFLLAYRAGWRLSTASLISNTTVSVLLVAFGLTLFRERPSALNFAGILVCLIGLAMVNWQA